MELLFRIGAFALVALVLVVFLQQHSPHTGLLLALLACLGIMAMLLPQMGSLLQFCRGLASRAGLADQTLLPLYKVMGVALCTRIIAELCRDNNQKSLAAQVELCGAVCGLLCALPLLQRALELIGAVA